VELMILLAREDDGRWIAELPALPGVLAYGESRDAAIRSCKALALRVIAERIEQGEDIVTGQLAGTAMDVPPGLTFAVAA
jgi:predicted RNase H-like HicB family nuclease